jgi:hypothetical protein
MITGVRWFSNRTCVGIVQYIDDKDKEEFRQTGQVPFYYAIGGVPGDDEETDKLYVATFGVPFDTAAGNVLFGV